jgi:flagellar basal body rod protein FlgG
MAGKRAFALAFRLLGVTAAAGGVWFLSQRLMAMSAATSEAVEFIAHAPQATGFSASSTAVRPYASAGAVAVIRENIANANTPAYKRRRSDIDGPNHAVNHPLDLTEGPLDSTGNPLDVAILGEGFLHIQIEPTTGDGTGYTRMGSLIRNANGDLVVNLGTGYELIPAINLPKGATNISISQDGTVGYTGERTSRTVVAGHIFLTRFVSPEALATAGGVYIETAASGSPQVSTPGDEGTGQLTQGYLEQSNVDPKKEYASLQQAQRAW